MQRLRGVFAHLEHQGCGVPPAWHVAAPRPVLAEARGFRLQIVRASEISSSTMAAAFQRHTVPTQASLAVVQAAEVALLKGAQIRALNLSDLAAQLRQEQHTRMARVNTRGQMRLICLKRWPASLLWTYPKRPYEDQGEKPLIASLLKKEARNGEGTYRTGNA